MTITSTVPPSQPRLALFMKISPRTQLSTRCVAPRYSVIQYGAVGNGSTDDSTAIQNAVNAAQTAGGGVVMFAPGKTYAIGTTANLRVLPVMGTGNFDVAASTHIVGGSLTTDQGIVGVTSGTATVNGYLRATRVN